MDESISAPSEEELYTETLFNKKQRRSNIETIKDGTISSNEYIKILDVQINSSWHLYGSPSLPHSQSSGAYLFPVASPRHGK